jgi:hypothetical protein
MDGLFFMYVLAVLMGIVLDGYFHGSTNCEQEGKR